MISTKVALKINESGILNESSLPRFHHLILPRVTEGSYTRITLYCPNFLDFRGPYCFSMILVSFTRISADQVRFID